MGGWELFFTGLGNVLEPFNFSMMVTGLIIGVLAGALPGITMMNAIVLVLPFTYIMGIVPSLLLMSGIYCGGVFGGSITGILFNIPGDPMNVPTTWEGYKLNKKGFVSKALGMAIMCSAIGGVMSGVLMTLLSPPFAKIALSFSSAEYFAVVFMGMVSVIVIESKSVSTALISLFFGMLLGTIGMDEIYGAPRFTFGSRLLETGINFTIVLIGLFAIGEVLEQLCEKGKTTEGVARLRPKVHVPSLREFWEVKGSLLRGLGVGVGMGALPGAGATVTSFVSYGLERQCSKKPELFGTGVWEGLVASETAINGSTGGAMMHLFALGIPGSGATAVMMGAFLLHGIQPGPLLFTTSPVEVYTIFVGFILCNLVMIPAGVVCSKFFSELMRVPENILGAFIIVFCLLGAYGLRNDSADLWYMALFGIIGYFMRRFDLPVPPLVLGVILGPLAERFFMTTMISSDNDISVFFTRPVSGSVIIISLALFFWPILKGYLKQRRTAKNGAKAIPA
jgi:putative tricarboxylic transport membrane protein